MQGIARNKWALMKESVTELAHAKINLTLEVLGKRSDSYHDVASVILTVSLADRVTVSFSSEDGILIECDDVSISPERNLAHKAAKVLGEVCDIDIKQGIRITIEKRIPVSSGMGGGSADAAAVLRALNTLWELRMSHAELAVIGAKVGSDVPFLVHEGVGLIQGRGEDFTILSRPSIEWIVAACPKAEREDKTRSMFLSLQPSMFTNGALTRKLAARINGGGDCPPELFFNVFEDVARKAFNDWESIRSEFEKMGAREIRLTGAGSAMYALAPTRATGLVWHLMLEHKHKVKSFLFKPWVPGDAVDSNSL